MVSNLYFTHSTYLKYLVQGRFAESSSAFSQMLRHIITCFRTPLWLALPLTIQTLQQVALHKEALQVVLHKVALQVALHKVAL